MTRLGTSNIFQGLDLINISLLSWQVFLFKKIKKNIVKIKNGQVQVGASQRATGI